MKYTHLNLEEREKLYALHEQGYSFKQISNILNRAHTTLSREYKRNAPYIDGEYIPIRAHNRTKERGRKQRLKAPLKSPEILLYVRKHLKEYGWSPETISGRLKLEKGLNIHQETIYRYIYHPSNRKEQLWKHLTLKRKKRKYKYHRSRRKENKLKYRISIEQRPKHI